MHLRNFERQDIAQATQIWNDIIANTDSFPGEFLLTEAEALEMFAAQTRTVCAIDDDGTVLGLYILHPNNIGRCAHIANASYAVCKAARGKGIGKALVSDSVKRAKECGFLGLQFNAVVSSNTVAVSLYLKLGFSVVGTVKNGYRLRDGRYTDTLIFLKSWEPEEL